VQREVRDHLDLEREEREAQGIPAEDAERLARRTFANPA
jgi:hypothetical protein